MESEFIVRSQEFAVGVAFASGRMSRGAAIEYLMERRWTQNDARAFLTMAAAARL